ncbi:MAG: helix-turn-helix transcriptional regulator [Bacteroides sp.]|nr:helix-turn-helix transcriptional regulator [Bacteroides sp.]
MEYKEIVQSLKSSLVLRYGDKKTYQKKVADVLGLTIPTIRRRLSGKNPFTLQEISVISEELDIPVDEIFYSCRRTTKQPLEFVQYDFTFYDSASYEVFDQMARMFSFAAQSDNSRLYITSNTFPDVLNPTFEWLTRFAGLQWLFFTKGSGALKPLSEIELAPQLQQRLDGYLLAVRSIKKSVCLVSTKIVENYLTDIRQFYILGYLSNEEVLHLVSDIEGVLKLFDKVCTDGYLENGKEMEIYCTDSFFSSDMYIVESDRLNFGMLRPNPFNPVLTKSKDVCQTMARWFKMWKRPSTLISQSGTHIRRQFMETQYQALYTCKDYIGI